MVTYVEHVIVAGGLKDDMIFRDDIEILNWQGPQPHWRKVNVTLPVPMWEISLTVSGNHLLIVGYNQVNGCSSSVYQQQISDIIMSPSSDQPQPSSVNNTWVELPSVSYYGAALVSHSNPPVAIGGIYQQAPTSNVCIYDVGDKSWRNVGSLSSPRIHVAVAILDDNNIIVIGGHTEGRSIEEALASSLTTVERGRIELAMTAVSEH